MAWLALLGLLILLTAGRGSAPPTPTPTPHPTPTVQAPLTITLGDIDPDEPAKKINRFQPLADYLARNLGESGIQIGRVVIARDIEEMGQLLRDGSVDVYFDSAFPTLSVQGLSGSEIILRR